MKSMWQCEIVEVLRGNVCVYADTPEEAKALAMSAVETNWVKWLVLHRNYATSKLDPEVSKHLSAVEIYNKTGDE